MDAIAALRYVLNCSPSGSLMSLSISKELNLALHDTIHSPETFLRIFYLLNKIPEHAYEIEVSGNKKSMHINHWHTRVSSAYTIEFMHTSHKKYKNIT